MSNDEPIKITAKQLRDFDEISAEKRSTKETLEIALRFHANCMNQVGKRERELWAELLTIHSLDHDVLWIIKDGFIRKKDSD